MVAYFIGMTRVTFPKSKRILRSLCFPRLSMFTHFFSYLPFPIQSNILSCHQNSIKEKKKKKDAKKGIIDS